VEIDSTLADRLESYYRLLATWSQRINLTGLDLSSPTNEAFDRLLIEPLAAAAHRGEKVKRVLDIGSGGGSPAIPMALAMPGSRLVMVESKVRKSVFLLEAVRELEMDGVEVVNSRFELLLTRPDLHEAEDLVTIRAVRLDARVLMTLQLFLRPGGSLFLFRGIGRALAQELVAPPLAERATFPLLESLRSCLVVLEKVK